MMTDNVNVEEIKKKRQYAILKAAVIVFAVLVVFAISFAVFTMLSGTFGLSDELTADAWTLSNSVSTSGGSDWVGEPGTWVSGTSIFSTPTAMTAASGFTGTSFNTSGGSSKTWYFMQMYEVILNDNEVAAVNAGYIGTISLTMYLSGNVGSDFMYNWGRTQYTVFIAAGSSGGGNKDSFTSIGGASATDGFDKEKSNLTTKTATYTLPKGTKVVRYGISIQFKFNGRSWYWPGNPTVTFGGASISSFSCTQLKTLPKLTVKAGANGTISSNEYSSKQLSINDDLNAISAIANEGYYFTGWTITGGNIHTDDVWSNNDTKLINTKSVTLAMNGPAARVESTDSNNSVTATANFAKITVNDNKASFTYLQDTNGLGVGQGPYVSEISGYTFQRYGTTSPESGKNYYSKVSGGMQIGEATETKPYEVGDYRFGLAIMYNGEECGHVVIYFEISPLTLGNVDTHVGIQQISFNKFSSTDNITSAITFGSYAYSSLDITPSRDTVYMKFDGVVYTLKNGTDFTWGYANNNSVGNATATIYAKSGGNFLGNVSIPFSITRITLNYENVYYGQSAFTVDGSTYTSVSRVTTADGRAIQSSDFASYKSQINNAATTIQRDGNVVYTGFELRPHDSIKVIYVWIYAELDVNTHAKGIVIFPLVANGVSSFIDESGTTRAVDTNTVGSYINLNETGASATVASNYQNNINACTYATDGTNGASVKLYVNSTSTQYNVNVTDFRVYFDIAKRQFGNAAGEAQGSEMDLIYSGGAQQQKNIQYVFFRITIDSGVYVPGSEPGGATVVYAAVEDGISSPEYNRSSVTGTFAPWDFGLLYEAAYFDIGTADTAGDVSYSNNIEAGTATMTLKLNSKNLEGTVTTTYQILPLDVNDLPGSGDQGHSYGHTIDIVFNPDGNGVAQPVYFDPNAAVTPTFNMSISNIYVGSNPVKYTFDADDYIASEIVYSDNTNAGTATIHVPMKGNYKGTYVAEFQIMPLDLSGTGYVGYITDALSYQARQLNRADDFAVVFGDAYQISIVGETFKIPYLKVSDVDTSGNPIKQYTLGNAYGNNTDVSDSYTLSGNTLTGNAYFTLVFTAVSGNNDISPNYTGSLKVYFNIGQKYLWVSESAWAAAEGTEANGANISASSTISETYNRSEHTPADDVRLSVTYNGVKLRYNYDYTFSGDYKNNVDAGTALLAIEGIGNYAGKCWVPFEIAPYSLVYKEGNQTLSRLTGVELDYVDDATGKIYSDSTMRVEVGRVVNDGSTLEFVYYYKNSTSSNVITPKITAISVYMDNVPIVLTEGVNGGDFVVSYEQNGNVGVRTITIEGVNNYTGTDLTTVKFRIEAIQQTVSLNSEIFYGGTDGKQLNEDELGRAAYQISASDMYGTGIRVSATTSAISPAVKAEFVLYEILSDGNLSPVSVASGLYTVAYDADSPTVDVTGKATTGAVIKFNSEKCGGYYIVGASFPGGTNFYTATVAPAATDTSLTSYSKYSFLVKYEDDFEGIVFGGSYMYGDGDVSLPLAMKSGNNPIAPQLTSVATNIIEVVGKADGILTYSLRIKTAGTTSLTFSHEGYLASDDYSNAYFAFTKTAEYVVSPRPLTVFFGKADGSAWEVDYGDSSFNPGMIQYYTFVGLASSDEAGQVAAGFTLKNYGADTGKTPAAGDYLLEIGGTTQASKYNNYSIKLTTYAEYAGLTGDEAANYTNLRINKATLTVTAYTGDISSGNVNVIYKVYGTANPGRYDASYAPDGYKLNYTGFKNGDTVESLESDAGFVPPEVDYLDCGITTETGSHPVTLKGGSSVNYVFVASSEQYMTVQAAEVNIFVYYTEAEFSSSGIGVKYEIKGILDENGEALDDFTYDAAKELIFFYYPTANNVEDYTNTQPRNAGTYGVAIRYLPTDKNGNYKETTTIKLVDENGDLIDEYTNSIGNPIWNALNITPYHLSFGYGTGTITAVYDEGGILLSSLLPMESGLSGEVARGSFTNVEFRNLGIDDAPWQNLTITGSSPVKVALSGGTWDIRFDYTSENPNYSDEKGYVLKGSIIISASAVNFTYLGGSAYSGVYNGDAHELSAANFTLEFPDDTVFSGSDFPAGQTYNGVRYGDFYFGFMPEGNIPDFGQNYEALKNYLMDQGTQAVNVGNYSIWAIYIPYDMEADFTYTVISRSESGGNVFEITPKMLTANDFMFAGKQWTYDATPHTLEFGIDIFIKDGVLVGAEAETGQLPGNVRIMFRKNGVDYASVIDQGQYDIVIEYTSVENNNYSLTSGANVMTGLCSIARRAVEIVYSGQSRLQYTYNGSERGISANLVGVNGVMPTGGLVYKYYDASGMLIDGVPVNVGTYTVGINYAENGSNDNFVASASDYNPGVTIVITSATPSIIIYPVSLSYEEAMNYVGNVSGLYSRLFRVMLSGNDVIEECGSVSVSYGIRTSAGISWSDTFPFDQGPGSYEVRVSFITSSPNYQNNTQNAAGALTIRLPSPDLSIASERHTFTGEPIGIDSGNVIVSLETGTGTDIYYPAGTPGADKFYYGLINVEYRATGSTGSWSGAPINAGTYDVRLTYTASLDDTMFSNGSNVIEGALTIDPVEIRVIPVFGQGKVYDGDFADQSPVAYMYSYVVDGVLYFEYSVVTDVSTGYRYDISKGEYSIEDAVYTVYGGILTEGAAGKLYAEQWRDYELSGIEYARAVYTVDGISHEVDLSEVSSGITDIEIGGTLYRMDVDRLIIYPAVSDGSAYAVTGGIFLSYTDPAGGVYVVAVDTNSANYVYDGATDTASYTFTRNDGLRVSATLDFGRGTADDFRGRVYTIIDTVASIETDTGIQYMDFGKLTGVSSDGSSAVYKFIDGSCYLILTEEKTAVKAYSVEITAIGFGGGIVDITALPKGQFNGEYVYSSPEGTYIFGISDKSAKKVLYYGVSASADGYVIDYNGTDVAFSADGAGVTAVAEDYYVFESGYATFYVDLASMIARDAANRGLFDLSVTEGFDFGSFLYTLYDDDGNPVAKAPLFGKYPEAVDPALTGVDVTGSVSVSGALNNGFYQIGSSVTSPSANYTILSDIPEVYYFIDLRPVTIEYTAPEDLVYDGTNKIVGYEISGVVEGENVNIILTYEGDNTNVTEEGFKVNATLTGGNDNYYLVGGESETYMIELAEMNDPVWALTTTVVYDGLMHTVELSVDDGAEVTYLTESRFVEPGTYSISVTVSKPNYRTISSSVLLTIKKAVFSVVPDAFNGKLVYGDDLPELTANTAGIDGTQLGSVVLDPGQQLVPGTHEYTWSFLPYDPVSFYSRYDGVNGGDIRGSIQLIVEKAQAAIEIFTNLDQSETNPLAIIGSVNGSSLNELEGVTIEYVDGSGNRFASLPTAAGRYTVVVTYEGDELYAETVKEFVLTIEEESNFEWLYYVLGAVTVLAIGSLIFFLMKRGKKYE